MENSKLSNEEKIKISPENKIQILYALKKVYEILEEL